MQSSRRSSERSDGRTEFVFVRSRRLPAYLVSVYAVTLGLILAAPNPDGIHFLAPIPLFGLWRDYYRLVLMRGPGAVCGVVCKTAGRWLVRTPGRELRCRLLTVFWLGQTGLFLRFKPAAENALGVLIVADMLPVSGWRALRLAVRREVGP